MSRGRILRGALGVVAALIVAAFVVASVAYYYEFPGYCRRLEGRARDPKIQRALQAWVARNWSGAPIPPGAVLSGDGIGPGFRWLPATFDGSVLGMGPKAHVRLLGVGATDVLHDAIASHVEAIYFTERSQFGVLVQLPEHNRFVTDPAGGQELISISDRVSVMCTK